jgi:hypothetical protein
MGMPLLLAMTFWTLFSQGKLHVLQKWFAARFNSGQNYQKNIVINENKKVEIFQLF